MKSVLCLVAIFIVSALVAFAAATMVKAAPCCGCAGDCNACECSLIAFEADSSSALERYQQTCKRAVKEGKKICLYIGKDVYPPKSEDKDWLYLKLDSYHGLPARCTKEIHPDGKGWLVDVKIVDLDAPPKPAAKITVTTSAGDCSTGQCGQPTLIRRGLFR